MKIWMKGWKDERIKGCHKEMMINDKYMKWWNEWKDDRINQLKDEWIKGWKNKRMNDWEKERIVNE